MHIPHQRKKTRAGALRRHARGGRSQSESVFLSLFSTSPSHAELGVLAGVHLLLSHARLTLHVAAPAHLTVAGQAGEVHGGVVAPSAAQALTAGVFGARAAARTRGVTRRPAEAGRLLQVHQVGGAEVLAVAARTRQLRLAGGGVGDAQHPHGVVVAVLEQTPGVVEGSQLLPTSPYSAGAGDAVTLAGCFQAALHRLKLKGGGRVSSFSLIHYSAYLEDLCGHMS